MSFQGLPGHIVWPCCFTSLKFPITGMVFAWRGRCADIMAEFLPAAFGVCANRKCFSAWTVPLSWEVCRKATGGENGAEDFDKAITFCRLRLWSFLLSLYFICMIFSDLPFKTPISYDWGSGVAACLEAVISSAILTSPLNRLTDSVVFSHV